MNFNYPEIYLSIKMLPTHIIGFISNYTDNKYKLLDKDIYIETNYNEKSKEWFNQYNDSFKIKDIKLTPFKSAKLAGASRNYNWKKEYIRISMYDGLKIFNIPNINNLQKLSISNNKIKKIPKEMGNLNKLEYLVIDHNKIKKIPKEMGNLNNLEYLWISNNQIKRIQKGFEHTKIEI